MKIVVLFILIVYHCQALDVFIAVNGTDTNSGTTEMAPVKTFTKALSLSRNNLNIKVAAGSYYNVEIILNNRTDISIESISKNPQDTILFKTGSSLLTTERNIFYIKDSVNVTISGFDLVGRVEMPAVGSLIKIETTTKVVMTNCVLQDNMARFGSAIYSSLSENLLFEKLYIHNNTALRQDNILQNFFTNNKRSNFNITNSFMGGNTPYLTGDSAGSGGDGAIYLLSSTMVRLTETKVEKNRGINGAAIFLVSALKISDLVIENSYFVDNQVTKQGSIIFGDERSRFEISGTTFVGNKCVDWKCKIVYSKQWEKTEQPLFQLLGASADTHRIIVTTLQLICVILMGFVFVDSILLGLFLLFREIFLYKKNEKKNKKEQNKEELKEEMKEEEKEEKKEEIIQNGKPVKKKGFLQKFKDRQKEKRELYDDGPLPTFIAWMFSTVGLAYPKSIPRIWRLFHNFLVLTSLLSLSFAFFIINTAAPIFQYDSIALIEAIASSLEYQLVPFTPLCSYLFLIGFTFFSSGIIIKKRSRFSNVFIIIGSLGIIAVVVCIIGVFNAWDGGDWDIIKGGWSTFREISVILYWQIVGIGAYYSVLIILLDFIHYYLQITSFFDKMKNDIVENRFNFVTHTAKLFDFQNDLIHSQNLANIFIVPCVVLCLGTVGFGLLLEIFGFGSRFSAGIGRYLYFFVFGGISFFLLLIYAIISAFYSFKYNETIESSIIEINDNFRGGQKKEKMKTIEQLRRFENYTSTKLFQFKFAAVVPLTIGSLFGRATLLVTAVTIFRTLVPLVISQFYSQ
eukprot:gene5381-9188_t